MGSVELPNEIWLEVLSTLDYRTLKTCERINKTFQIFVRNVAFDKTLFRSREVVQSDTPIILDDVKLHPAFESMCYGCYCEIEDVCFLSGDGTETPLTASCAASEHATKPPVSLLQFQIHSWRAVHVKNDTGVSVLQVMKALCRFFGKKDRYGYTRRDAMGDHNAWTGWDETLLDGKGRLLLRAEDFDS